MKNDDFIITYLSPIKKLKKFLADLVLCSAPNLDLILGV